jgi:hypothetical protein
MSISNLVAGSGRFTANGNVAVVVPCPNLTASSVVLLFPALAPAPADPPTVSVLNIAVSPAVSSFSVVCGGANANVYNYIVLNA